MRTMWKLTILVLASCLVATACADDPPQAAKDGGSASVKAQKVDQQLRKALPSRIRSKGTLVSVDGGAFPPYTISSTGDARRIEGATVDMGHAIGQMLGVTVKEVPVEGLPGVLTGIQAGRYDMALGPIGDFADREAQHDFVDWVQEFVVFAVPKGNPKKITSVDSTCGLRIAVQAGGSAEAVVKQQASACTKAGKPAVQVQSFKDQPTSILAVSSGRSDAFFSSRAPLTYFVKQSHGKLQLAGTEAKNGFADLYQGAVVPKGSPLRDVLLKAFQRLHENGTYAAIMKKWGLQGNMLEAPDVNLGKNS
jgi:polar amino acid transport system substrate-binding protein